MHLLTYAAVADYLELMKSLFDFDMIKTHIAAGCKLRIDCLSGTTHTYRCVPCLCLCFHVAMLFLNISTYILTSYVPPRPFSGVAGPYARRIFVDELGANPDDVVNSQPLPDFGGTAAPRPQTHLAPFSVHFCAILSPLTVLRPPSGPKPCVRQVAGGCYEERRLRAWRGV